MADLKLSSADYLTSDGLKINSNGKIVIVELPVYFSQKIYVILINLWFCTMSVSS